MAPEHRAHHVLAQVVQVSLHRGQDDLFPEALSLPFQAGQGVVAHALGGLGRGDELGQEILPTVVASSHLVQGGYHPLVYQFHGGQGGQLPGYGQGFFRLPQEYGLFQARQGGKLFPELRTRSGGLRGRSRGRNRRKLLDVTPRLGVSSREDVGRAYHGHGLFVAGIREDRIQPHPRRHGQIGAIQQGSGG
ncbi:MAG: hypothetical protein BWY88_00893 [Synergistetes bacterium ADurb.Bin520]|nr:MAG: hypothetical protein BWY88_00893 [Synergistetes bacterium ADurb.Bin520]